MGAWSKPGMRRDSCVPGHTELVQGDALFSIWVCQTEKMWTWCFGTPLLGEESRGENGITEPCGLAYM